MIDEAEEERILRYLLGEMDASAKAEFEARLAEEPETEAAVKSCRDALADFALDAAPAVAVPPAERARMLNAVLARRAAPAPDSAALSWWRHPAWPIAAGLLFCLNLWQWSDVRSGSKPERPSHWASRAPVQSSAELARSPSGAGGASEAASPPIQSVVPTPCGSVTINMSDVAAAKSSSGIATSVTLSSSFSAGRSLQISVEPTAAVFESSSAQIVLRSP